MPTRVEVICEFHTTRSFGSRDNLIARSNEANQFYRELTEAEIGEVVERSLAGSKDLVDALVCLACLHPDSLKPYQQRFIEHGLVYPGVIYHDADEQCAATIVEMISTSPEMLRRNHLLVCMAWAGNAAVQNAFARWRDSTPAWASDLHVPPHAYALEAGWELLPNGTRRDLFLHTSLPLVVPSAAIEGIPGVNVGVPTQQSCQWCQRPLVALLEFERREDSLACLSFQGPRLRVVTCDVCSCYGRVFSKTDGSGNSVWHPSNQRPEYLPDDSSDWDAFPERPLVATGQRRHFMESASWTNVPGVSFSQVGGLPTWIQDAEYPDCPDCLQKMLFIGQISNEDFNPMMEGIEYCFFCPSCNVACTNYQQS